MTIEGTAEADRAGIEARLRAEEGARRPASRDASPLLRLVPFLMAYPGRLAAAAAALIVAAGTMLIIPMAARGVVDGGFSVEDAQNINRYFLFFLALAALLALSSATRFYYVSKLGERVVADLRAAVYAHLLKMSPAFFEVTRTGEVLSRLTTDTTLIQTVVGSTISFALRNALMLIGALGLLVWSSPSLAALVLLATPFIIGPMVLFGRWVRRLSRASQDRVADTSALAGERLSAVATLQAFSREAREARVFADATEAAYRVATRRILARAGLTALAIFLVTASVVAVLWVGANRVLSGDMSGGELVQFILYALLVASSVGGLSEVWGEVQRAAGATERLMELLGSRSQIADPPAPVALPSPPRGAVAFENVTFRYPARPEIAALDDVSFQIAPGECVALVGPSGAGKSTVFQLLLRFFDPTEGRVCLDGVPLCATRLAEARSRLALVPQDPVIFSGTIAENIAFARPDVSEAEIVSAAEAAAADGFIRALPEGYRTRLGERGITLSGGQRQRLAIARALLKDAPVLLLDEATSALDAESEKAVEGALKTVMEGRTTLIIAHRLSTVRRADRILVLDEGRIVAEGRHGELLNQGGLYARFARLQLDGSEPPEPVEPEMREMGAGE